MWTQNHRKRDTYEPYQKLNSNPNYISKYSNRPPNIIKGIPKSICKKLSDMSCNWNVFEKAAPVYETVLQKWFQWQLPLCLT